MGGKGANSSIAKYRACHKRPIERQTANRNSPDQLGGNTDSISSSNLLANGVKTQEGIQVKTNGAVGDDQYGERFHAELNKSGVDTSGIITVPNERPSICFVIIDTLTRKNRCLVTLGAIAFWKKDYFMTVENLAAGTQPDLVIAQTEIDRDVVEQMIETAGEAAVEFCLNAAPATPISKALYRHVTHLQMNESEAAIISSRKVEEVNQDT